MLGLLLGCGETNSLANTAFPAPSPLLAMDSDRLWILLWARGDMEPGCARFYEKPDDPRYADRKLACERWELNAVEMLQANGVASVGRSHLREAMFWEWYGAQVAEIAECSMKALHSEELSAPQRLQASISCDPYRRLTRIEKRSVEQAGLRIP